MAKRVTKTAIVEQMAKETGLTKIDANAAYEAFVKAVKDSLKAGNEVALFKFGTFKKLHRKARTSRNPQTGAKMKIKAHEAPTFSPSAYFKNELN